MAGRTCPRSLSRWALALVLLLSPGSARPRRRRGRSRRPAHVGGARRPRAHLVRSRRDDRDHHALHVPLCAPRRAREADARQPDGAEPGRVLDRVAGRPQLRVRPAPRREVPQRRSPDRRGRQVLARALSRGRLRPFKTRLAGVDVLDPHRVRFRFKQPWPDFMTFYGTPATRRGLDRSPEVRREGGRRRLQEGARRRRPLQVRLVHTRRGAGARGPRGATGARRRA